VPGPGWVFSPEDGDFRGSSVTKLGVEWNLTKKHLGFNGDLKLKTWG